MSEWTNEQQTSLEQALRAVPKDLPPTDRWMKIGNLVEGKTAKECLARYKDLARIAKETKVQADEKQTRRETELAAELAELAESAQELRLQSMLAGLNAKCSRACIRACARATP